MLLIRPTQVSGRQAVAACFFDVDYVAYDIVRGQPAEAAAEIDFSKHSFRVTFPGSSSPAIAMTTDMLNYSDNEAVAACGIVTPFGDMSLDEGVIEHNYTGNTSPGAGSGGGSGLSGVTLNVDQSSPDNPALQLRQDSIVVTQTALPKANSAQAGIITSTDYDRFGGIDMDGGDF